MPRTGRRPTLEENVASALKQAVIEQVTPNYGTSGIGEAFFRVWMKERGHAFFFLFKKNLKVTNIQFAELLSLVSCNTTDELTNAPPRSLQFASSEEFQATVQGLMDAFPGASSNVGDVSRRVAELHGPLIRNTVVVDTFYGSCSLYLPPHLKLDLKAVCGLSGYIHSCGRNVFVRKIGKATKDHFFTALRRYLDRYPRKSKRIFFTVYAHEDFTRFDGEHRGDLTHGLDDVKIHIEKFFMTDTHLVDVLKSMREDFKKELAIPDPGDFRDQHQRLRSEADIDQERTLWLIADYRIGSDGNPSEDRYFICYDQLYDNKNPLHIFDENKPAWIEHTTIPHTLMAAMVNVTAPFWPIQNVVMCDPFVGTGTTWLECVKHKQVSVRASDKNPLACLAAHDNAQFFALDIDRIRDLMDLIESVTLILDGKRQSKPNDLRDAYAAKLAVGVRKWAATQAAVLDEGAMKLLATEKELVRRILFYLALRTNKRHAPGFSRRSEEWGKAFSREATLLWQQMDALVEVKEKASTEIESNGLLSTCPGGYSSSVTLDASRFTDLLKSTPRVRDARTLGSVKSDRYDVIITDPPYAFNTDGGPEELARLYVEFLRGAIRSLNPDGQLLICLPERSIIGKTPFAFTHRNIVTHQVLALAEEANREVLVPARSLPAPPGLFGPPFYWASERALRRSILHFRLRMRSGR